MSLAETIVDRLLTTAGGTGDRLAVCQSSGASERDLGGWCRSAAVEQVRAILEPEITTRFHRHRWSASRRAMDAMQAGATLAFPMSEESNVRETSHRLNAAYRGRRWTAAKLGETMVVLCEGVAS